MGSFEKIISREATNKNYRLISDTIIGNFFRCSDGYIVDYRYSPDEISVSTYAGDKKVMVLLVNITDNVLVGDNEYALRKISTSMPEMTFYNSTVTRGILISGLPWRQYKIDVKDSYDDIVITIGKYDPDITSKESLSKIQELSNIIVSA